MTHAFGPAAALNGAQFHYNFRFNCELGERYKIVSLNGGFESLNSNSKFNTDSLIYSISYSSHKGEDILLFRKLFAIPRDQEPGVYEINACLEVNDKLYETNRCLDILPKQIEVVFNNN